MKTFKTVILTIIISISNSLNAQNLSDKDKLALAVWIPDNIENMSPAAQSVLKNKLLNIVSANGITGSSDYLRFVLEANVQVISKEITTTAPIMQAYTLSVDLYVGDGIDGKAYSSYSTQIKGVGENETKAYIAALKNIKTNDPEIQKFIEKGKSKIIAYFNSQCGIIIRNAEALANQHKFDEALWNLSSIPDVCTECWNKSTDVSEKIFKQKINFECRQKINEANNVWNAGQNWDAAQNAGIILSSIDPNSECVSDIKILSEKIKTRIRDVDKREWDFKYDYEIALKRDLIKSSRDVGVAWGNGQAQNVTYKSLW